MKQDLLLPQILSLSSEQTGILLFNMAVNGMAANGHPSVPLPAATKLRRIVEDPNAFLMCPGVYDGYSARIALQVGFDGLYMVRQLIKLAVLQHACRIRARPVIAPSVSAFLVVQPTTAPLLERGIQASE